MKKPFLLFLFLLTVNNGFGQPGAYTGTLSFKVYHEGKMADLSNKKWQIAPHNITLEDMPKPYAYPGFYQLIPKGTPVGGRVKENFYLDIIFKKDTMKIYTPNFSSADVTLDSIPFRKGVFKIPQHIYDLKDITKHKYPQYTPKLNGDWSLFAAEKKIYKCYTEKVGDLDRISSNLYANYNNEWDKIRVYDSAAMYYSFKNNVIISTKDEKNFTIYQVKRISDTAFTGQDVSQNRIIIRSLFYRDNALFALIEKSYGRTSPSGTSYGIYKLHFIEENSSKELLASLERKQIDEDYEAFVKFANLHPEAYEKRIKDIKAQYQKIKLQQ
jgi:hypothetical protein